RLWNFCCRLTRFLARRLDQHYGVDSVMSNRIFCFLLLVAFAFGRNNSLTFQFVFRSEKEQ
ncbi:hypothetical protein, partial [Propionimicrobium sp. BV2F7]|uniref:hypothetical protein n=1 Tax=Propionimicrobium sp. BV2F7 TaxID=1111131 RepID=UPI001E4FDA8A